MLNTFPKSKRIRKRNEFLSLLKRSKHISGTKYLTVTYSYTSNQTPRLGIVATKKIGNAVVRNRGKRLVREAFRRNQNLFTKDVDLVCILRKDIDKASQQEIDAEIVLAAKKINGK